ncbi:MAG: S8 family serine peptidase [Bacteroidota bacterium]
MTRVALLSLSTFIVFISCQTQKKELINDTEFEGWYHEDFENDSLPGISLERAYQELLLEDNGEEVIVALIDGPVDIDHEDLKNQIYVNKGEIPNNNIDDDNNGYVDDINGWNYLGYNDTYVEFANEDYVRIIRRLAPVFEGVDSTAIPEAQLYDYNKFKKALALQQEDIPDIEGETEYRQSELDNFKKSMELFPQAYDNETQLFIQEIADTITPVTDEEKEYIDIVRDIAYYGLYPEMLQDDMASVIGRKEKASNMDYNERDLIGDDPYILKNIKGTPNVKPKPKSITHGTQVAGTIAATRENGIGVKGFSNKIKIMPLVIFPKRGHELDKDIANAIRYAADNGAKVINYSHGKYMVDKEEYILDAMKYAESKGVIIVSAAGNDPKDLDVPEDNPFPKDNDDNFNEFVSNHIKVGASGKRLKYIKPPWSSYGKNNVDLFAPGQRVMTTQSGSKQYFELGGSSLSAAMVTGTVALLYSQYPSLTMEQVKEIILNSGTKHDREVQAGFDKDSMVNFLEMSRSGSVLNVYNALKMAKEKSKAGE